MNINSFRCYPSNCSTKDISSNLERPVFYTNQKLLEIPHLKNLPNELVDGIHLASLVFPFKVNTYVLDNLIDWKAVPDDPIFRLVFPHPDMLCPKDREKLRDLLLVSADQGVIDTEVERIRLGMNPHPSDQSANIPIFESEILEGMQHKYNETVLFFPKQGQTCHSYCSFCFRWPQFIAGSTPTFETQSTNHLYRYLRERTQVTDLLLTGGDPMVLTARRLRNFLEPLLSSDFAHIKTVRFGTKSLTYWPHRFLHEKDSAELIDLFRQLAEAGRHVAMMAHVNHWRELRPEPVSEAIALLRKAGVTIRTQSPLLHHINDDAATWQRNWSDQVSLGLIPYYMFVERDTGASTYFGVPLARALAIYQETTSRLSGIARTARGPVMSAGPGKVHILGRLHVEDREHFILSFLQARRIEWLHRPFLASFSETAAWLSDLRPANNEPFFFEAGYRELLAQKEEDRALLEAVRHG